MPSKLGFIFFVAIVTMLTGATAASAQLPSGERQLGQTIIEPGYDDRTGNLIYIMTPIGPPNPTHANAHAVSPLFIVVYPNSAAESVGTMTSGVVSSTKVFVGSMVVPPMLISSCQPTW